MNVGLAAHAIVKTQTSKVPVHTHRVRHRLTARLTLLASFRRIGERPPQLQPHPIPTRDDFLRRSGLRLVRGAI